MMGWGTTGSGAGGNSSSSTSNLSALAPPFTVGRLNPKPQTNPNLPYSESPYVSEPFTHPWQYAPPSAPGPEIFIDSTGITSVPISNDYRFSASASFTPSSTQWAAVSSSPQAMGNEFAYGGEVKPYYSPYVPSLVGEDSLVVKPTSGLSGTSQLDYSQNLFDLEYGPRWVDGLGFDDGKEAKISEFDGSFSSEKANVGGSHSYVNQLYHGLHGSENRNKSRDDSIFPYQSLNQVSDRESYAVSPSTEHMEDKSCLEQKNSGFFPYNSNTTLITTSSSSYPESYPSAASCEIQNTPNYRSPLNSYEKCVRPVGTPFLGRASVMRASPTVVIRPPPAPNGQNIASRKRASSENVFNAHNVDFDSTNPSKLKDSGLQSSSKNKEVAFETNLFDFSEQAPLLSRDTSDHNVKARFGCRLPDIDVSSGFVVAGEKDSLDNLDHHNTAVDSPCWKGAPSSQFLTFDIETGNSNHAKVNLDECYGFRLEEHKNLHSMVGSDRDSEKVNGTMGIENGVALDLEKTLNAICSTKERSLLDRTKDTVLTNKGVDLIDGPNMLNKEPNLLNNFTSVFDFEVSEHKQSTGKECSRVTLNEVSEGAAIAVHAAEKVLASPASQEDATEHNIVPDQKLDVQATIKAIYSLSELLRVHFSSAACSLEEENTEALKHVISNLDTCLSKNVVQVMEPNKNTVGDTSQILGESLLVGKISEGPHMKSETANSGIKFDHLDMHEEKRNYSFPGKKGEKSPIFSPLSDDLDITENDDMTKSIKKVLKENFQSNEEIHSQALLFKNLWLQAEAKACAISYKARFDRIKIQMEEIRCRAPQENEDIAEMTSQVFISPDPTTTSELANKACDSTSLGPTLPDVSIPSMSGNADDFEASVVARFNILKSREENLEALNVEEELKPDIVDRDDASSVMGRFSILRSREDSQESISLDKEKQLKMIDGDEDFITTRLSILKSREENPKSIGVDEEKQPKMIDVELSGEKPHLLLHLINEGNSYGGTGYESLDDHLSVSYDQTIRSCKSGMMINENSSVSRDSSTSDWEHVLKEDFSWKNS